MPHPPHSNSPPSSPSSSSSSSAVRISPAKRWASCDGEGGLEGVEGVEVSGGDSPPPFHLLTVLGLEALQEMWNTTAASAVTVKETP